MNVSLILVRHGQSLWNLQNLFTGLKDPDLTPLGKEEAQRAGQQLKSRGVIINAAFASSLRRAYHSAEIILHSMGQIECSLHKNAALNERDYGALTGLNKEEARHHFGEEQIALWRRSYHSPPPNGESLRDTFARVVFYYYSAILPLILQNKTTLIVAHGNSLRALIMLLEGHSPETISAVEMVTGQPWIYEINSEAQVKDKEILI